MVLWMESFNNQQLRPSFGLEDNYSYVVSDNRLIISGDCHVFKLHFCDMFTEDDILYEYLGTPNMKIGKIEYKIKNTHEYKTYPADEIDSEIFYNIL